MNLSGFKSKWLSKGFVGGIVAMALGILGTLGLITADQTIQNGFVESINGIIVLISSLGTSIAGLISAYGRLKAEKKIE